LKTAGQASLSSRQSRRPAGQRLGYLKVLLRSGQLSSILSSSHSVFVGLLAVFCSILRCDSVLGSILTEVRRRKSLTL
jgi:hypothetical protein